MLCEALYYDIDVVDDINEFIFMNDHIWTWRVNMEQGNTLFFLVNHHDPK